MEPTDGMSKWIRTFFPYDEGCEMPQSKPEDFGIHGPVTIGSLDREVCVYCGVPDTEVELTPLDDGTWACEYDLDTPPLGEKEDA